MGMKMLLDIRVLLLSGILLRLLFLIYGEIQDHFMTVKFTDVDYNVFTDAARWITQGESPYKRPTYRYTPILAWLLIPNIHIHAAFGKIIFITCDIIASILMHKILQISRQDSRTSLICVSIWLLNPLTITVSSRGNAESIMAVLVIATLLCIIQEKTSLAAVLYGLSVHFKIYPVAYSLPIYLSLGTRTRKWCVVDALWPSRERLKFVLISVGTFVAFTALFYQMYGYEFLYETYIYHLVRRDIRHNFSAYFYMLYLNNTNPLSPLLGVLVFLPQAVLLVAIAIKFYDNLPWCCFLQTFVFVTFNKVCTSQYFLWYISLLPLIIPYVAMDTWKAGTLTASWFLGQALWLAPAYYLEFHGINTFLLIWLAGLLFFIINVNIIYQLVCNYRGPSVKLSQD